MSRRATDWAWRQDIKATMKLVLLALADRADEYHRAYPSAERLERDTRLNIKTIRSNLKAMQDLNIIRDTGKRRGSTKQITVWELLGVEDDVKHEIPRISRAKTPEIKMPENGHLSKIPENGHFSESKVPKIGSERYPKTDFKGTQNWVTEPVIEPVIESITPKVPLEGDGLELEILEFLNLSRNKLFENLNLKCRDYRPVEQNLKPIRTILKAKYTVDEIKLVIEHLVVRWGNDPEMRDYLSPVSIFRKTKFETKLEWAHSWQDNGCKPSTNSGDLNWDDTTWADRIDWELP